ncbi:MAG TPA: LysE family translocator [Phototrophicaceae bacterium]|nr:LysE family translocator [Phototrophicaceae bacterium]
MLLSTTQLPMFLTATIILLLTPGPAVLYIIARSVDQGRRAGLVSMLGIEAGNLFHAAGAALGISAILLSSALAFDIVKYLGAAYLIYLGIRTLTTPVKAQTTDVIEKKSLGQIFSQGMVVAILNPKTALFFFAFLPQFVDRSAGSAPLQLLTLGLIFVALAVITDGLYALAAGTAGRWLRGNLRFLQFQRYFAGTVYIGLGLAAAFSGAERK